MALAGMLRGRRWCRALGWLLASVAGGCANAPGTVESVTSVATPAQAAKPEQVVHRIEPARAAERDVVPSTGAPGAAALPRRPSPPESPTAAPRVADAAREKRAGSGGAISAKHLEAELNRLEAELK